MPKALSFSLAATSLLSIYTIQPGLAQGLMEGAGLMAMPKMVPGGDTVKMMTRGMNSVSDKMNGTAGNANNSGEAAIPENMKMTMPDGSVAIDPKKAKIASDKAVVDETIAAKIVQNNAATPAQLKEAENHLRNAIAIRNAIWGYGDAGIPKLLTTLGTVYERQKQPSTAEACYRRALVYLNKRFGPGSIERLDIFTKLTPILIKDGKNAEALSLLQQIAVMKERKFGATDPGTLRSRITYAASARALEKPEAVDLYKQILTDLDTPGIKLAPDKVAEMKYEIAPAYVYCLQKAQRTEEANAAAQTYASYLQAPAKSSTGADASSASSGATSDGATSTSPKPAVQPNSELKPTP